MRQLKQARTDTAARGGQEKGVEGKRGDGDGGGGIGRCENLTRPKELGCLMTQTFGRQKERKNAEMGKSTGRNIAFVSRHRTYVYDAA